MQVKKNKKIKQVKNTNYILNNGFAYKIFPVHQLQPKLREKCYKFLESIFPDNFEYKLVAAVFNICFNFNITLFQIS